MKTLWRCRADFLDQVWKGSTRHATQERMWSERNVQRMVFRILDCVMPVSLRDVQYSKKEIATLRVWQYFVILLSGQGTGQRLGNQFTNRDWAVLINPHVAGFVLMNLQSGSVMLAG